MSLIVKIKELNEIKNKSLFLEKDVNGREIYMYTLHNCNFTGENLFYPNVLLFCDNEIYSPMKEKIMSLDNIKTKSNFDYISPNINKIEKNPVFFFVYNTDNYFHFIYDTLPYLISYTHLKKNITHLKLLMNYPNNQKSEMYDFVIQFLELLNIKQDDILIVNENTQYDNVYISTSYTHDFDSNLPPRKEIYDLYHSMVRKIDTINIETPKKIYVSRRTWINNNDSNIGTNYTLKRKMMNEDELVCYLEKKGFKEVFTENLSTIEKIKYFSNAECVIGAIGGGVSNVLF